LAREADTGKAKLSWMTMTNERREEDRPILQEFRNALNSETRRIILNKIYRTPLTGAHIADEIGISRPSISDHLRILRQAQIIKEADYDRDEKRYVVEKYYTPNFPVMLQEDREIVEGLAKEIGRKIAGLIQGYVERMEEIFAQTSPAKKGWALKDVYPYIQDRIREAESEALGRNHGIPSWTLSEKPWCMIGFEYTEKQLEEARKTKWSGKRTARAGEGS